MKAYLLRIGLSYFCLMIKTFCFYLNLAEVLLVVRTSTSMLEVLLPTSFWKSPSFVAL